MRWTSTLAAVRFAFGLFIGLLATITGQAQALPASEGLVADSTELRVLRQFYFATGGPQWSDHTNWLHGTTLDSVATWRGVRVQDGDVVILAQYNNHLVGSLPASLGQLTGLQTLDLRANQLGGLLPASLGQLSQLQLLWLANNSFQGDPPATMGQLTQLRDVRLDANAFRSLPAGLFQWTQLNWFSAADNKLSGPLPANWGQLPLLQGLDLARNKQLNGSLPDLLGQCTKLQYLYLSDNQFSGPLPVRWGQLTELHQFSLAHNQLTGTLPTTFTNLAQLYSLDLSYNLLDQALPAQLAGLRVLANLDLSHNQLPDQVPTALSRLAHLEYVDLSYNQFSGPLPDSLGQGRTMRWLYLSHNHFDGVLPASLAQLPLYYLIADHNNFSGPIPRAFQHFTQLGGLDLSYNQLTGTVPDSLQAAYLLLNDNALDSLSAGYASHRWNSQLLVNNNHLRQLPSFLGLADLNRLQVTAGGNYLDFASLEPNWLPAQRGTPSPGWSLNTNDLRPPVGDTLSRALGEPVVLDGRIGGAHNHYQWQRLVNGQWANLPGQTAPDLRWAAVTVDEAGTYRTQVSNDWVLWTVLYSATKHLKLTNLAARPLSLSIPESTPTVVTVPRSQWGTATQYTIAYPHQDCGNLVALRVEVRLDSGPDHAAATADSYTLAQQVTITVSSTGGSIAPVTFKTDLSITQGQPEHWRMLDVSRFLGPTSAANDLTITISVPNLPVITGTAPATQRVIVRCVPQYQTYAPLTAAVQAKAVKTVPGYEQTLEWTNSCPLITSYQLQLLFRPVKVDRLDPLLSSTDPTYDPAATPRPDEWNQRGSLLETGSPALAYRLTLAEGEGTYHWRVRAIGSQPGGIANPANWGAWSDDAPFTLTAPDPASNWIYSRSFSEDGRVAEKLTFANGLQQVRQLQTRLATPGQEATQLGQQVVATQTLQDYVGRDAVTSLPIPLPDNTTGADKTTLAAKALGFRMALLTRSAGIPYEAAHFDVTDGSSASANTAREPLPAQEQGYYSSGNDRVADAEGYPFTRTVFSNDGTNRVAEQGGVGAALRVQPTNPHTVRTNYTSVAPGEMIRLFGREAPKQDGLYKVVTTDPNNVSSVTYQTKDGKTVATALSGGNADPGAPLQDLPSAGTQNTVTESITGNGQIISKTFVFTEGTDLTVEYGITPNQIKLACANSYCASCDYQVVLRLYDTNAEPGAGLLYPEQVFIVRAAEQCSPGNLTLSSYKVHLLAGSYRLERELVPVDYYPVSSNATIVGPSATTRTLAQHLDRLRATLQTKFPAAGTGVGNEPWAEISRFLKASDVDGLYAYLDAFRYPAVTSGQPLAREIHDGQLSYKIPIAGCDDYVYLPILADYCPVCNPGTLDFAGQLQPVLDDLNKKYNYRVFHQATSLFAASGYTNEQFNMLVVNMAANSNYSCQQLTDCWDSLKDNLEVMLYQRAGLPTTAPYDLVREFLQCTGLNLTTPVPVGGPKAFDLTLAYEQFQYDPNNQDQVNCIRGAVYDTYQVPPTPLPTLDVALATLAAYAPEVRKQKYDQIYECIYYSKYTAPSQTSTQTYSQSDADSQVASLIQQAQQTCEDRRAEFRRYVLAQLHQHGAYVATDAYAWAPGPGATGPPTITEDAVPTGARIVADCEVEYLVQQLVNACKGDIQLTKQADPANPTQYQVGSVAELEQLKRVMFGEFHLDINAASCQAGWKPVTAPASARPEDKYEVSPTGRAFLGAIRALTQSSNRPTASDDLLRGCAGELYRVGEKVRNMFSYSAELMEWDFGTRCPVAGEEHYATFLDARNTRPLGTATRFDYTTDYLLINQRADTKNDACPPTANVNQEDSPTCDVLTDAINDDRTHHYRFRFVEPVPGTAPATWVPFVKATILGISEPYLNFFGQTPTAATAASQGIAVRLLARNASGQLGWWEAAVQVIEENPGNDDPVADIVWKHELPATCAPTYVTAMCYRFDDPVATGKPAEVPSFDPVAEACNVVAARQLLLAYTAEQTRWVEGQVADFAAQFQQQCVAMANQQETFTVSYKLGYHHFTLYYYDRGGNLLKTVPPSGVRPLTEAQVASCLANDDRSTWPLPGHQLVTSYLYNSLHQLEKQNSPDGGETHFFYNRKGQLRFSQNARQRLASPPAYSYTRYDALGRVTEVGETLTGATGTVATAADELKTPRAYLEDMRYPAAGQGRQVTRTLYGDRNGLVSYLGQGQRYLTNRVAYSYYDVDGNPATKADNSYTYYSYDPHGNVEWLCQEQAILGQKFVRYAYDLISNKVTLVLYQENQPDQFFHRYGYDADNRLTTVQTSGDGLIWDQDARYTYFAHGPLKRLEVGEDHVQGVDYTYTLQGWLKGLNHPGQDPGQDGTGTELTAPAKDAFGMTLGYFTGDYTTGNAAWAAGSGSVLQPQYSLFNGNIATWTTKTRNDVASLGLTSSTGGAEGEQYRYDQLNRLTSSSFYTAASGSGGSLQATQDYATAYSYDPNGNLQTLTRNGRASLGQLAMDQLRYQYYDGSNQLKRVDDAVANQPYYDDIKQTTASTDAQYGYDALGNLTSETGSSGSKSIEWNVYGKIARVDQSNGTLTSFGYDAQGQRIHKAFTTDNGRSVRHVYYVRDAQGNVLAVYEQSQQTGPGGTYGALALTEQPLYGSSRLGLRKLAVSPTGVATESFRRVVGQKQYELSDHLGNVRALVSDIKRPDEALAGTYKPDLLAYYGYYPFGMLQPGRSALANGTLAGGYRYGYNGKEKDNNGELGLTTYDYGFRIYSPGLGKFLSVDPLSPKYPWYTPYQFAGDRPIWAIDIDGLEDTGYTLLLDKKLSTVEGAREVASHPKEKVLMALGATTIGLTTLFAPEALPYVGSFLKDVLIRHATIITTGIISAGRYGPDAISFGLGALGYDGMDLPGNGDELGMLVNKSGLSLIAKTRKLIGAGPRQNVLIARFTDQLLGKTSELIANSGKTLEGTTGIPNGDAGRLFETTQAARFDTEVKVLETFAHQLGGIKGQVNERIKGVVTMVSDLNACPSCSGVVEQFKQMFPNVKVVFGSTGRNSFNQAATTYEAATSPK